MAELQLELATARAFYSDNVQYLLASWKEDCHSQGPTPFFDLKCRELTGLPLTEAMPLVRPTGWPATAPHSLFAGA